MAWRGLDVPGLPRPVVGLICLGHEPDAAHHGSSVLIVLEGRAAGEAIGKKLAPVDAAIVGIIDAVDVDGDF